MQEYSLKVAPQDNGERLDVFLFNFSKKENLGLSRTSIKGLIEQGSVFLNGANSAKAHQKVKPKDEISFSVHEKLAGLSLQPENIPLKIIYEDDDIVVINKPVGLVTHPAPGNYEHTLVNALKYHFKKLSDINPQRPGIVHRLDKDTSGLLVIAKNNPAHLKFAEQFAEHSIKRKYAAVVSGKMEFDENVIEMPIGRHPYKRKNMAVGFGKNTKYAKTFYRTIKRAQHYSLLELEPFTGRTHQLRVHLAFIGHPIIGDVKYGKNNPYPRLLLHAKSIGFIHPKKNKFVEFTSDTPKEFDEFLKNKS